MRVKFFQDTLDDCFMRVLSITCYQFLFIVLKKLCNPLIRWMHMQDMCGIHIPDMGISLLILARFNVFGHFGQNLLKKSVSIQK